MNDGNQLLVTETKDGPGSKHAERERKRRCEERDLFRELSRYYRHPMTGGLWTRPKLMEKGAFFRCTGDVLLADFLDQ